MDMHAERHFHIRLNTGLLTQTLVCLPPVLFAWAGVNSALTLKCTLMRSFRSRLEELIISNGILVQ